MARVGGSCIEREYLICRFGPFVAEEEVVKRVGRIETEVEIGVEAEIEYDSERRIGFDIKIVAAVVVTVR